MAKIVLVHGMRMHRKPREELAAAWIDALCTRLRETASLKAQPECAPRAEDFALVFWGDLFAPPELSEEAAAQAKGFDFSGAREAYYAFLRTGVLTADAWASHNPEGRNASVVATYFDRLVYQSAVYMHNGPVYRSDPREGEGAYFQVQARFRACFQRDTRIVIGHSLGSVIAYEGLCAEAHEARTFITVGSPMATPDLILAPLRARQEQLLYHLAEHPPLWPGVTSWINVCADTDVWCAPVPRLAPLFGPELQDVIVHHGSPHDPQRTHDFLSYLQHDELVEPIARALVDQAA